MNTSGDMPDAPKTIKELEKLMYNQIKNRTNTKQRAHDLVKKRAQKIKEILKGLKCDTATAYKLWVMLGKPIKKGIDVNELKSHLVSISSSPTTTSSSLSLQDCDSSDLSEPSSPDRLGQKGQSLQSTPRSSAFSANTSLALSTASSKIASRNIFPSNARLNEESCDPNKTFSTSSSGAKRKLDDDLHKNKHEELAQGDICETQEDNGCPSNWKWNADEGCFEWRDQPSSKRRKSGSRIRSKTARAEECRDKANGQPKVCDAAAANVRSNVSQRQQPSRTHVATKSQERVSCFAQLGISRISPMSTQQKRSSPSERNPSSSKDESAAAPSLDETDTSSTDGSESDDVPCFQSNGMSADGPSSRIGTSLSRFGSDGRNTVFGCDDTPVGHAVAQLMDAVFKILKGSGKRRMTLPEVHEALKISSLPGKTMVRAIIRFGNRISFAPLT